MPIAVRAPACCYVLAPHTIANLCTLYYCYYYHHYYYYYYHYDYHYYYRLWQRPQLHADSARTRVCGGVRPNH